MGRESAFGWTLGLEEECLEVGFYRFLLLHCTRIFQSMSHSETLDGKENDMWR